MTISNYGKKKKSLKDIEYTNTTLPTSHQNAQEVEQHGKIWQQY